MGKKICKTLKISAICELNLLNYHSLTRHICIATGLYETILDFYYYNYVVN